MLKKLLLSIVVLIFILIGIALVLPSFLPEDRIRKTVFDHAREMTGYDISVAGDLKLKFFPYIGVYMEDVTIGKNTGKVALATLKSLNVEIGTMAFISGNLDVKSLVLDSPVINLAVSGDGRKNWQPKISTPAEPAQPLPGQPVSEGDFAENLIRNIKLQDVRIINGFMSYNNVNTKEKWDLKKINVDVSLDGVTSPFKAAGDIELNKQTLKFKATVETLQTLLSAKKANITFSASNQYFDASADGKLHDMGYNGKLNISSPSVTGLIGWANSKPMDAEFASAFPLKISSNAECSASQCVFSNANLNLDTIEAKGKIKALFSGVVPYIELAIDTNVLDLNLFKTQPKKTASLSLIQDANAAGPAGWSDERMDFSALRSIDLVANVNTQGLKINNIKIGKTIFRAKIQRGKLSSDIIDAEFYGGKANITASVDTSTNVVQVEKRIMISGVNLEPLLIDAEVTDRFSGKTNIQMNMVTTGSTEREMISNMHGAGNVQCTDGAIKGINIAEMVRNVQSAFKPVDKTSQKTDFSEAGGTFTITKGVVNNNDLIMKAPLFRVKGEGNVNLPLRTINYRLNPQIVETIQGQGGKEKAGIGVPIIIGGTIDNPTYRPDLESTIKEVIQNPEKAKEAVDTLKQQLKENKGNLKGLLKQFKQP